MEIEHLFIELSKRLTHSLKEYKQQALGNEELNRLSMNQYYYIISIAKLGSPSFSDLARAMNFSKPSVTATVNKLIQMGYVTKSQSVEDKRLFHIQLSEKGKKLINAEEQFYTDFARNIKGHLSEQELGIFYDSFVKIIELLPER